MKKSGGSFFAKNNSGQEKYDHLKIEKKQQKEWAKKKLYKTDDKSKKPKCYVLDMFPYPSGEGLHVGHVEGYTATDIFSRYKRLKGFNVLHPMGWDAFGLPAENFAIKHKVNPVISTKKNIDNFRRQLKMIGFSYDWDREINTTDPNYYKWTQWIFLQLYKKGLAYESYEPINWCPSCQTGLANEDLEDGRCERCGSEVEKKPMRQWVLRITDYADRLLKDLDLLRWPESVKESQRNWIGRSEGTEINFPLATKRNYVLLHGFKSSSKRCFFPWLKNELEKYGHQVTALDLPNHYTPVIDEQVDYVLKNAKFDNNTIIVGHSLGTIIAMKVLEKLKTPIARTVLVSGLIEPDVKNKSLPMNLLFNWRFDIEKIKKNSGEIKILRDLSDTVIGDCQGQAIQKKLGGELVEFTAEKPHTCGHVEPVVLEHTLEQLPIFTTRADTLFGATYMVVAPEHPLIKKLAIKIENLSEVKKYISQSAKKTELERTTEGKEKTGVELKGLKAINPANGEEVPIFTADYVLPDYGLAAIMAVPAHDTRDFEFAKKFNLPIKEVVIPSLIDTSNPPQKGKKDTERNMVLAIVYDPKTKKYLTLKWKQQPWISFITGGIEDGENTEEAAKREILEETGYKNVILIRSLGKTEAFFFAAHKDVNRKTYGEHLLFELVDNEQNHVCEEERNSYELEWLSMEEMKSTHLQHAEGKLLLDRIESENNIFVDSGVLINSDQFSGLDSERAKKQITKFVRGKMVTKYKLRDWVFSRQRYWGEPIPIIHCDKCALRDPSGRGVVPVPEKDLPVTLPKVKSYAPTGTGESPLADITKWVNVKCPVCGSRAKRETNTMPQWAGSSWYYLRFIDPKNKKSLADPNKTSGWLPTYMYVGGVEHATRHLIYARFWHKFLFDQGLVKQPEPFLSLKNQGLILGEDSRKMSKRWGNVINPDDMVKLYGADTLRLYEMFMGPFEMSKTWNTNNMIGCRRFLERLCRLINKVSNKKNLVDLNLESELHKAIKKVSIDIENFSFNTAISAMMIFANQLEKAEIIPVNIMKDFLKILSPFAPHLSEELWSKIGEKKSINLSIWPIYNEAKIKNEKISIVVSVNGRPRDNFTTDKMEISEAEAKEIALSLPTIKKWTNGCKIVKIIYVPNKLINIVLS